MSRRSRPLEMVCEVSSRDGKVDAVADVASHLPLLCAYKRIGDVFEEH
ncbi:MAG: hypothetical protein KDB03_20215 [Planctomycetales bacterium]|nr:hypothetical protein [Planctomycetales bacterium]